MQGPLPLSAAIITFNEESNLSRCLQSLQGLVSEIVVVDSGSSDGTADIARKFGASFHTEAWEGHVVQKNKALSKATQPWVLCLDADEALSSELTNSIRQALAATTTARGFWLNRKSFYLGDWVRHTWYPEWRLRLVLKEHARWEGRDPHDKLSVDGETARLQGDLYHYSYASLQDHLERTIRYCRISAEALAQEGFRLRWYHLVVSPWAAFLKRLVVRQGWRDGWRGWIIAFTGMLSVFGKYAFLLEKKLRESSKFQAPSSR